MAETGDLQGSDLNPAFRTTRWTAVLNAGQKNHPEADDALAELCRAYWFPLYSFIRRKGYAPADAQDLTQGFFAKLLEKNFIAQADRQRGRFRTFLLASLDHFLSNERERAQAVKRGGRMEFISWEAEEAEGRYGQEPSSGATPETLYERQWAVSVLARAMQALREEFVRANKTTAFDALQVFLSGEKNPGSYAEVAAYLGVSEGHARVEVHRLRKRYGETLRAVIADTVAAPHEVEEELRHLLAVLSR